jgi:hypothetical protein
MKQFLNSWRSKLGFILIAFSSYIAILSSNILHFAVYALLIIILLLKYEYFIEWKNIKKLAIATAIIFTVFEIASIFIFGAYYFDPPDSAYEIGIRIGIGFWTAIHYYFALHGFMFIIEPFKHKRK